MSPIRSTLSFSLAPAPDAVKARTFRARRGPAWVALLLALGLFQTSCDEHPQVEVDHVLLIVIDTLRADHLGAYGHRHDTSPKIDALAQEGLLFERALSQCSWTAPSMISMLSSRYVASALVEVPQEVSTLPEWMRAGGYETAAFVTNGILDEAHGFARGFDHYHMSPGGFPNRLVTDWLTSRTGKKTFTYVHLGEPHSPYGSRSGPWSERGELPELAEGRLEYYDQVRAERSFEDFDRGVHAIRESLAGYDDDISSDDRRVGGYIQALKASGQWERTAVVLASDHGEGLWTRPAYQGSEGERRAGDKGNLERLDGYLKSGHGNQVHRELVHVPLIVVAPGLEPARLDALVENVDIVPTLLELCDLPDPGGLEGSSLVQLARRPEDWIEEKPWAFTSTRLVHSVVTPDGWQLMLPSDLGTCRDGLQPELFSLVEDPEARRNVIAEQPELVRELELSLRRRLDQSLRSDQMVASPLEDMGALQALGYLNGDVFDWLEEELEERSNHELLETIGRYGHSCLVRLKAATQLAQRQLSRRERGLLHDLLKREPSVAVRDTLKPLLRL